MSKDMAQYIDELNQKKVYPFHMPGHKRSMKLGVDCYNIDITEIDGYDNLHKPEGMIAGLQGRIAALYGAQASYVLVNGSTCGILAAISAVTQYGDHIIMARNSHKSAYNAVCLRGLTVKYIDPEYIERPGINGQIAPEELERCFLQNEKQKEPVSYKAVYITSPTYEGVVSNIEALAKIAHRHGALLIVDEAHGAHFGLDGHFPETAVRLGADIDIQSIHKTLMGMTQTALLHIGAGAAGKPQNGGSEKALPRVDKNKLEYYLSVYQSSSPSYVLMSSVDRCIDLLERKRKELFEGYYKRLMDFYGKCREFSDIRIFAQGGPYTVDKAKLYDRDCGKLVIFSENAQMTGRKLYDRLREKYGLQLEMSLGRYCLAMTSCMDREEGFLRLYEALKEIDGELGQKCIQRAGTSEEKGNEGGVKMPRKTFCTIARALEAAGGLRPMEEGIVAADYAYVYPPGIPIIVPGEIVTNGIICDIMKSKEAGYEVHGVEEQDGGLFIRALGDEQQKM